MPRSARLLLVATGLLVLLAGRMAHAAEPGTRPASTRAAPTPLATLDGPTGTALAFGGESTRLLAAGSRTVRVWDARASRPVTEPLDAGADVRAAALSTDGRLVVAAAGDRVEAWDARTGARQFTLRHGGPVNAVGFDVTGQRIVTACDDRTARLWDAATGKQLSELKHADMVKGAWLSPDGRFALTARVDPKMVPWVPWRGIAQLWDATTGKELPLGERSGGAPDGEPVNLPGEQAARPVAFAPDGRQVLIAFASHVPVVDTRTGRMTALLQIAEVEGRAAAVGYADDGRRVLAVSKRGRVQVWDVESRELVCPRFGDGVADAALTPDGTRAVTVGPRAGDAGVWDLATGERLRAVPAAADVAADDVPGVALSPDGTRLALGYPRAGRTVVWPVPAVPKDRPLPPELAAEWRPARKISGATGAAVGFSRDGRRLLAAGGAEARVWDPSTGQPLAAAVRPGHPIRHATLSADGVRVMAVGEHEVRVWDVATGKPLAAVRHAKAVRSAALDPDGTRLVTAANGEPEVRVRDAGTGDAVHRLAHPGPAYFAAFSPDGSVVLTLAQGGPEGGGGGARAGGLPVRQVAILWEATTGKELRRRAVDDWVHAAGDHLTSSAAFSPDGRRVATMDFRRVAIWDAGTGKEVVSMDTLDEGMGTSAMVFSPDGARLLTLDGSQANLWDASREELVVKLNGRISDAAFAPDGRLLVGGGQSEGAGLWDVRSGRPLLRFRGREHTAVPAVAFGPAGDRFAVGYGEEGETTVRERRGPQPK